MAELATQGQRSRSAVCSASPGSQIQSCGKRGEFSDAARTLYDDIPVTLHHRYSDTSVRDRTPPHSTALCDKLHHRPPPSPGDPC